jgi:metal-sulfur cluster biosynthetic enzyme
VSLKDRIIAALKRVYDPEMPVNIYDLGLIYGLDVDGTGRVSVRMTLTAPNCPVAGSLPASVERRFAPCRA